MQNVSETYRDILSGDYWTETSVQIDGVTYGEDWLISMETGRSMFSGNPTVGGCAAGTISIEMLRPAQDFPRMASIIPMVRICNSTQVSEWIRKGRYFVDTRQVNHRQSGEDTISITGYDAILLLEQDYGESLLSWPAKDIDVLREVCRFAGISLDSRTISIVSAGYDINYPSGYSCRETAGYIAAMYGGTFVMSDIGELLLARMADIPPETRYLIDRSGNAITFGGVRIIV